MTALSIVKTGALYFVKGVCISILFIWSVDLVLFLLTVLQTVTDKHDLLAISCGISVIVTFRTYVRLKQIGGFLFGFIEQFAGWMQVKWDKKKEEVDEYYENKTRRDKAAALKRKK